MTSLSTIQPTGSAPPETKNRDDKGNISNEKEGVSDGKTNDGNNGETSRVICTRTTHNMTEKEGARVIGRKLASMGKRYFSKRSSISSLFFFGTDELSGTNSWEEGFFTWENFHAPTGHFAMPSQKYNGTTITTVNQLMSLVPWNRGILRMKNYQKVDDIDHSSNHHAYFLPDWRSCEPQGNPHLCLMFKALRRGHHTAKGTKVSVDSILRLTNGALFYSVIIWKDNSVPVADRYVDGEIMLGGIMLMQEEVDGSVKFKWANVSSTSSKHTETQNSLSESLRKLLGAESIIEALDRLDEASTPVILEFLASPTIHEQDILKLNCNGTRVQIKTKPIVIDDDDGIENRPKILMEPSSEKKQHRSRSNRMHPKVTTTLLPNDIFNAFNGLNREVSSLASAMKSSHEVYMKDQHKQQQQQQDEGSRRSKGVDTSLEIQTLKKSVTEAEKSEARAQQLQKVAEQERTQALTNLAAVQQNTMQALTAQVIAAEKHAEAVAQVMQTQQVMCMAQQFVNQKGSSMRVEDMTTLMSSMNYGASVNDGTFRSGSGGQNMCLTSPALEVPVSSNSRLSLTNGDEEPSALSPKTAKLMEAKKLRGDIAKLKRKLSMYPDGEKKTKKMAKLKKKMDEAALLEEQGMESSSSDSEVSSSC